jgi:hypothetical protein
MFRLCFPGTNLIALPVARKEATCLRRVRKVWLYPNRCIYKKLSFGFLPPAMLIKYNLVSSLYQRFRSIETMFEYKVAAFSEQIWHKHNSFGYKKCDLAIDRMCFNNSPITFVPLGIVKTLPKNKALSLRNVCLESKTSFFDFPGFLTQISSDRHKI